MPGSVSARIVFVTIRRFRVTRTRTRRRHFSRRRLLSMTLLGSPAGGPSNKL